MFCSESTCPWAWKSSATLLVGITCFESAAPGMEHVILPPHSRVVRQLQVNILSRRAGQHILHVGSPSGRLERGSVGHGHADVPEPAFMRAGQRVGREEPPGLGPRIAESMPYAAGNPKE